MSRNHLLDHLFTDIKVKSQDKGPVDCEERADAIAATRTPCQARAARDTARFKAVRCPRRAGKSFYVLTEAFEACLRKPNSIWVIAGLTRPSIKNIFWGVAKKMATEFELGLHFMEVDLDARFTNGSVIQFRGAKTRDEIEKLRGGQYDGIIIDECKSFDPAVLNELVDDVITPALADRQGRLIIIGTPGTILAGPFYDATCSPPMVSVSDDGVKRYSNVPYGQPYDGIKVWSFHTWTVKDNTAQPHLWALALQTKATKGWSDEHPTWRREYLGEWVPEDNARVYKYFPHIHNWLGGDLPAGHTWTPVIGLDVGFHDADALVVVNYSRTSYDVYVTYAEKRTRQSIAATAAWVETVRETHCGGAPEVMVGDFGGLATKVFAELAETYQLYFEPAEKQEKLDYIMIVNGEFDAARIKILHDPDARQTDDDGNPLTLGAELLGNRWLERTIKTLKKKEDPATQNDLCDAFLYAWRWCDHRRAQPPDRRPTNGSPQWWDEYLAKQLEDAKRQNARHRLKDDWWKTQQEVGTGGPKYGDPEEYL